MRNKFLVLILAILVIILVFFNYLKSTTSKNLTQTNKTLIPSKEINQTAGNNTTAINIRKGRIQIAG